MGWALLVFVLALGIFQARNLLSLRGWRERAHSWSTGRKLLDAGISFLIPTVILIVVFSQIRGFFGYRFNLTYQMTTMASTLTDITILMVLGSLPDYVQGVAKLFWWAGGKSRP